MTEYFVATNGDNGAAGTTEGAPWATIAFGLTQLVPGDILTVRGGRYFEWSLNPPAGASGNPITIRNYPGETPILDGSFTPTFRSAGNSDWEVFDAARNIYRSVGTFGNPGNPHVWIEHAGDKRQLWPAPHLSYLSSDEQTHVPNVARYLGPGIVWDSGTSRYYIRLEKCSPAAWIGNTFPELPDTYDPRDFPIYLSPGRVAWTPTSGRDHIVVDGIEAEFFYRFLSTTVAAHWTIRKVRSIAGRGFIALDSGSANNFLIEDCVSDVRPIPFLFYADAKVAEEPASKQHTNHFGLQSGVTNILIRRCNFSEAFDGVAAIGGTTLGDIEIHNCNFGLCWDDAVQLGTGTFRFSFHHNYVEGSGPSHHGSGVSPDPATKYFHHNVFNQAKLIRWGRQDLGGYLAPNYKNMQHGCIIGTHSSGTNDQPDPWKFYNNTVIMGTPRGDSATAGLGYWPSLTNNGSLQEVMNNIFVLRARRPNDNLSLTCMDVSTRIALANEAWDGNLYFTEPGLSWLGGNVLAVRDVNYTEQFFATLAAFRAHATFDQSKTAYPPGYEANGIDTLDPLLDPVTFEPAAAGVHVGAVDLAARGLPGGEAIRGAGPWLEVGVPHQLGTRLKLFGGKLWLDSQGRMVLV